MKSFTRFRHANVLIGGLLVAGLTACGGGGDGGTSPGVATSGTLRLALTDAPACGFDAVNVTVQKVRVHQSNTANDDDAGWSEVVLSPARKINLLNLRNGVLDELGQTPLPTGRYTQMRMVLAENTGNMLANSVVPTGGTEVALKTPSGQQSGVKANITIDIAANRIADFIVDFDACKSVVTAGNSGSYILKPVVSVIPRYISAVRGFVDTSLANGNTAISLQQNGVVIKATSPDSSTGQFLLQPVSAGSYTLVMAAPGRTTAVVTNVQIATDTVTSVNSAGAAFSLPASPTGTVNGTAPQDTLVRASQVLSSGTSVEVAGRFVDSVTGAYSFTLPVNAPLVTAYAVATNPLVFTADTASAGRYGLQASSGAFASKTLTLPALASGATISNNITFP